MEIIMKGSFLMANLMGKGFSKRFQQEILMMVFDQMEGGIMGSKAGCLRVEKLIIFTAVFGLTNLMV